jgi:hypothetical protein
MRWSAKTVSAASRNTVVDAALDAALSAPAEESGDIRRVRRAHHLGAADARPGLPLLLRRPGRFISANGGVCAHSEEKARLCVPRRSTHR